MPVIGGAVGYHFLKRIAPRTSTVQNLDGMARLDQDMERALGAELFERINGKTVIDFGCGPGGGSVFMALNGADRVIGLDIQERFLVMGRALAEQHGVADRCTFVKSTEEPADVIVSKDAFEHFSDPASVLVTMHELLKPGGVVLASFGPTWLHPYGGHLFSIFPWAHLIFTEGALIRWRSDFKHDGATRFGEVEGGLNEMTIRRFTQLVESSPLTLESLQPVPIKGIAFLAQPPFREFGTSIVRCVLRKANEPK